MIFLRITGMVEKLCHKYGNHLVTYDDVAYHTFPPIEALAKETVESELRTLGFGYRAKFIQRSAAKLVENGGRDWLLNLRSVTYPEAKTALMTLPGVGAKVFIPESLNWSSVVSFNCRPVVTKGGRLYMPNVAESQCCHSSGHARIPDCQGQLRAAPESNEECDRQGLQ